LITISKQRFVLAIKVIISVAVNIPASCYGHRVFNSRSANRRFSITFYDFLSKIKY